MFIPNLGTKELTDALRLAQRTLALIPNQPVPRAIEGQDFKETQIAADYLWHLLAAVEGQKSVFDLIRIEHQAQTTAGSGDTKGLGKRPTLSGPADGLSLAA